jgi:two-component system LytT family response regulator/two-component system response regulator LytT
VIRAILVDDEKLARAELAFLLRAHPDVEVVAEARNGTEALQLIQANEPDLVFLDINMPGQGGLAVARQLLDWHGEGPVPQIVFATAYDQHAVQAFEVNAVDYLLKPIEKGRLAQCLQRVRERIKTTTASSESVESALQGLVRSLQVAPAPAERATASQQAKVLVRSGNKLLLVDPRDLIFASMLEGRLWMVARECEGESTFKTLDELHAALPGQNFWRLHRSHLVNIDHIREVVPWFKSTYQLKMNDRKGSVLPVSRAQTKRLKELFNL